MRPSLLRSQSENARETSESILDLMQELASHLKDPTIHDVQSLQKWFDREVFTPHDSQSKIQLLALGHTLVTSHIYEIPARVSHTNQPLQFTIYRFDLAGRRWYSL